MIIYIWSRYIYIIINVINIDRFTTRKNIRRKYYTEKQIKYKNIKNILKIFYLIKKEFQPKVFI
jgi:hypothetical protein